MIEQNITNSTHDVRNPPMSRVFLNSSRTGARRRSLFSFSRSNSSSSETGSGGRLYRRVSFNTSATDAMSATASNADTPTITIMRFFMNMPVSATPINSMTPINTTVFIPSRFTTVLYHKLCTMARYFQTRKTHYSECGYVSLHNLRRIQYILILHIFMLKLLTTG